MHMRLPSSGKRHTVPGFFAADGKAAETSAKAGNQWRAHFAPDETGEWWNWQTQRSLKPPVVFHLESSTLSSCTIRCAGGGIW